MSDKGASPQHAEIGVPAEPGPRVGHLLLAARLRHGQQLWDVAHALRIRLVHLQAIEDGRYEDLPGPTYAIGFVRAYADHIGLDSEEVVRRFKYEVSGVSPATELKFPVPLPEWGMPRGAILFVGVVVASLAYGGWYVSSSKDRFFTDLIPPLPDRLAALLPGGISPEPEPATTRTTPADASAVEVADRPAPPAGIAATVRETAARPELPAGQAPHVADREPTAPAGAVETAALPRPADMLAEAVPAIEAPPVSPPSLEVETEAVVTAVTVETLGPEGAAAPEASVASPPAASTGGGPGVGTQLVVPPAGAVETAALPRPADMLAEAVPAIEAPPVSPPSLEVETEAVVMAVTVETLGPEGAAAPEASVASRPAASTGGGPGVGTQLVVPPADAPDADWAVAETGTAAEHLETTAPSEVAITAELAPATATPDEAPTPVELVAARPSVEGPAEDVAASDGGTPPAPGTIEAESDEQIAALTDDAESPSITGIAGDGPQPAAAEDKSRILVRAKMASWIQVRDDVGNQLLLTRLMRAGDTYSVPDRPGLKLLTGNAGALAILVDGEEVPPIGPLGAVRRDVTLEIERLREGTAVTD